MSDKKKPIDNDELHSAIEQIKLQERENEIKLKEKHAIETTLASLKRNLHETEMRISKLKEEYAASIIRVDGLTADRVKAQILLSCLTAQIETSNKELQRLKIQSEQGISKVWEQRNGLCHEVQKVSDQCDVWALFTKPNLIDLPKPKKLANDNINPENQQTNVLENALKKRQSLITELERLQHESEKGKEFIRIRNALRYSEDMAAQIKDANKNI